MDVFVSSTQFWSKGKFWTRKGLYRLGDAFNENQTSELHNSEILGSKKGNKKPELSNSEIFYLVKFSSYLTRFFYFRFIIVKFPSYEK